MLVLSRKPDEAIVIGGEVTVSVLSVRGKQVRLGIEAPREVAVNREEVHRRIKAHVKPREGSENPTKVD